MENHEVSEGWICGGGNFCVRQGIFPEPVWFEEKPGLSRSGKWVRVHNGKILFSNYPVCGEKVGERIRLRECGRFSRKPRQLPVFLVPANEYAL